MGTKTISDKLFSCNHKSNPVYGIGKKKKMQRMCQIAHFMHSQIASFSKSQLQLLALNGFIFGYPLINHYEFFFFFFPSILFLLLFLRKTSILFLRELDGKVGP